MDMDTKVKICMVLVYTSPFILVTVLGAVATIVKVVMNYPNHK